MLLLLVLKVAQNDSSVQAFSLPTSLLLNDGPARFIQSSHGATKQGSARHVCSKLCVCAVHVRVLPTRVRAQE